jgi:hypothetical protein
VKVVALSTGVPPLNTLTTSGEVVLNVIVPVESFINSIIIPKQPEALLRGIVTGEEPAWRRKV